jgi:superfamily II DNA or RNA helicase
VYEDEKTIGDLTFITYASLLRRLAGEEALEEAVAKEGVEAPKDDNTKLKIKPEDYGLVVWDEAHQYLSENAQKMVAQFKAAGAVQVGLTATPRYYKGKELGISLRDDEPPAFGKNWYELKVDKAIERKEMPPYENILINTSLETGLGKIRPDEEESGNVAEAINRDDRNRIIADLYLNAEVPLTRVPEGMETPPPMRLAGEPTLVFGAGINHVHDIADEINKRLTPLLKTDEKFRAALQAKGINPDDPELVIAAPIYSGGTKDYAGMSLDERQDLVKRYEARKVLMLVSTSVLQQSFDSKKTSVVIDAVPRQTYVGIAQAAMRACRNAKNKPYSVLINMEDNDHKSLTFEDFVINRGVEKGVSMPVIEKTGNNRETVPRKVDLVAGTPDYQIITGQALESLVESRRIAREEPKVKEAKPEPEKLATTPDGFYFGDDNSEQYEKYLTPKGSEEVNRLMQEVRDRKEGARDAFITFLQPWQERFIRKQCKKFPLVDEEFIRDEVVDAFIIMLQRIVGGEFEKWTECSTCCINPVRKILKARQEQLQVDIKDQSRMLSLEEVPNANQLPASCADVWEKNQDYRDAVNTAYRTLEPREQAVVRQHIMQGGHLEALTSSSGVTTKEGVRQIKERAIGKLQKHPAVVALGFQDPADNAEPSGEQPSPLLPEKHRPTPAELSLFSRGQRTLKKESDQRAKNAKSITKLQGHVNQLFQYESVAQESPESMRAMQIIKLKHRRTSIEAQWNRETRSLAGASREQFDAKNPDLQSIKDKITYLESQKASANEESAAERLNNPPYPDVLEYMQHNNGNLPKEPPVYGSLKMKVIDEPKDWERLKILQSGDLMSAPYANHAMPLIEKIITNYYNDPDIKSQREAMWNRRSINLPVHDEIRVLEALRDAIVKSQSITQPSQMAR